MTSFNKFKNLFIKPSRKFFDLAHTLKGLITLVFVLLFLILPFFVSGTFLYLLGLTFIFTIAVVSWDIISGFTGQLNLGHSVSVGIGAYISGLLFLQERFSVYSATYWLTDFPDLPIPLLIIIGGIGSAFFGLIIGSISLRLKGHYLALVTIILPLVFVQFTGIFSDLVGSYEGFTLGLEGVLHPNITGRYYISFFSILLCLGIIFIILRSRWGIIFKSIKDNEPLARSAGINTYKYKLIAFVSSSFFAGIAGGLFAFYRHFVGIDLANLNLMLFIVLGSILGGLGTFYGPIIGAFFVYILKLWVLPEYVSLLLPQFEPNLMLFFLVVLLIAFLPRGLYNKIQKTFQIS